MHGEQTDMETWEQEILIIQIMQNQQCGEGGSGYLGRIIDISAGNYGSSAINEFGWVYIWGNGSYGEIGNGKTESKYYPTKNPSNIGISVSLGAGHTALLGQNAKVYTFGRNLNGELGNRKHS